MRKRLNGFSQSLAVLFIFFILGVSSVSGIVPDRNGLKSNGMVNKPLYYYEDWHISPGGTGGYYTMYNSRQYTDFFFNITLTNNSTGYINCDLSLSTFYSPALSDVLLNPGESYSGNFTYIGEYDARSTEYFDFVFTVESGADVYVIFEAIIWDGMIYVAGWELYITIISIAVFFAIVIIVLARHSKGKSSPKLT